MEGALDERRLRLASLGRAGVALLDATLPARGPDRPVAVAPRVSTTGEGWLLSWPGVSTQRGLRVVVRAVDGRGTPVRAAGPFRDRAGRHRWAGPVDGLPRLVPWGGLSPGTTHLDLLLVGAGARAEPVGHLRLPVEPPPILPFDAGRWADPLAVLAGAVVHADGTIHDGEVRAVAALLQEVGADGPDVDAMLARPTPARLDPVVAACRSRLGGWGPRTLLEAMVRVAVATGAVSVATREVLHEIAHALGAPPEAVARLLEGAPAPSSDHADLQEARLLLGVPPDADPDTVKRAWRRQVQAHHPDRAAPEDRADATRTTARLNAAYRALVEAGGARRPAPPRQTEDTAIPAEPTERPAPPRPRLSPVQLAMGWLAVALLATAVGVAWNGHAVALLGAAEQLLAAALP